MAEGARSIPAPLFHFQLMVGVKNTAAVCRSLGGLLSQIYDIFATPQNGRGSPISSFGVCGCAWGC